ncbi:UNVERIFIED_CONTAM: AP-2 complex subunit mu [Sesamum calycinum]|uniref:AP-2 complex subunit mu n=1 Tax=Sesamum calycinum TaxID=2727403 RepID=A0AAW2J040_9LAMI
MVDAFRVHIMQTKELGTCPVRQIGGCSFFYMRISNVYIVIVVSSNANVACAFKFVVEAVTLFKSYFGGAFDEDAIRNNFVLIYELLDDTYFHEDGLKYNDSSTCASYRKEIKVCPLFKCRRSGHRNNGFWLPSKPFSRNFEALHNSEGVRSPFSSKAADKPVPNATLQVTGAVGWRREGLVYKKNEVFLDIVESVNLLMSSKGSVLRCDVTGKILMKCFLSGMPDLKLGLNDKIGLEKESQLKSRPAKSGKTIELDDVTFHQCVNLTRFNSEKTVSFVPPDGEFELMKYRITEGVNLPFRVLPTIKELGRTRMEVNVKVKSVFGAKMFALGVVVKIPVPKQTAKTSFQVTSGRAKYNPSIDCLVWKAFSLVITGMSNAALSFSGLNCPLTMDHKELLFVDAYTIGTMNIHYLSVPAHPHKAHSREAVEGVGGEGVELARAGGKEKFQYFCTKLLNANIHCGVHSTSAINLNRNATELCQSWIRKFPGQTEPTLSAEIELISTITEKKSWTRPPIQMEFQVPMFTASGLRVRFLKVWEKSGYNTVEWVRYITKAGSYEIRC